MKNNGKFLNILFSLSLLLLTAIPTLAQDKTPDIDKIFSSIKPTDPGCTVAVSQNGKTIANRAYGMADLERNVPLAPDMVLDAGSVVKQFVAASVLMLVEEGKLSLTEDIRKYMPEIPDPGQKVTIDHLMTHTSGVRDWQALRATWEGDPTAIQMAFKQRGLNFKPGDEWGYSNTNYELLKEIVTRVSGMPFSEFTKKRLFEPLKMNSSNYVHDMTGVIKNRALAYKKEKDGWKLDMYFGNDRGGSGGLLTTAADLITWNTALQSGTLGKFVIEKLHEPAKLNNGRKISYARGLRVDTRGADRIVWHSGGAAGYSALSVALPDHKLAVAIMCNADGGAKDEYASWIFDLFLPPLSPEPASIPSVAPPADLSARAGIYFNEQTGQPLQLAVNNNNLVIAGGGPLVPVGEDRFKNRRRSVFFMSEADFELQFDAPGQFEIKTKEGEAMRYRRGSGFTPPAAELEIYTGRYDSPQMGAVMEIVVEKTNLMFRFYRNPDKALPLKPVDKDTFMAGPMLVRFVRDKDGKIVGYDYSNSLLRNIRYAKL